MQDCLLCLHIFHEGGIVLRSISGGVVFVDECSQFEIGDHLSIYLVERCGSLLSKEYVDIFVNK